MKDLELSREFGLSKSTISDWKNLGKGSKYLLYKFISSFPDDVILERLNAIKLLDNIKVVEENEYIMNFMSNMRLFGEFNLMRDIHQSLLKNIRLLENRDRSYSAVVFKLMSNRDKEAFKYEFNVFEEENEKDTKISKVFFITKKSYIAGEREESIRQRCKGLEMECFFLDMQEVSDMLYSGVNIILWQGANG